MANILVIDDDHDILEFVSTILGDDHTVATALNGEEGLASCHAAKFDLVITDIFMPFMDGLEIIRELRKALPDTKIIAITAEHRDGASSYLRLAKDLGAAVTVSKPFSADEMTAAVNAVIG